MRCRHCNSQKTKLGRLRMASGKFHFIWYCLNCEQNANSSMRPFVGKKSIPLDCDPDSLPILIDYMQETFRCEVCGEMGAELHHWAPRELWGDSCEQWPQSYLCPTHHNEWHRIVTIPLRTFKRREQKLAKELINE